MQDLKMNKEKILFGAPLIVLLPQYRDNVFPIELSRIGLTF
jgi:hypothetical protein